MFSSIAFSYLKDLVKHRRTVASVLTEPGTLRDGDIIQTSEYSTGNGGGNRYFLRKDSKTPRPVEMDLGFNISLNAQTWLQAINQTVIDARQFSATTTGDQLAVFQDMAKKIRVGSVISITDGTFSIAGNWEILSKTSFSIRGNGVLQQLTAGSRTLQLVNCSDVNVERLGFRGLGSEPITADPSWNNVAGVHIDNCTEVSITKCKLSNHAGGGIRFSSICEGVTVDDCDVAGIGKPGISVLDNTSDVGIGSSGQGIQGPAREDRRLKLNNNRVTGHAFGIGCGGSTESGGFDITVTNNSIFKIPGQHAFYLDGADKVIVANNIMQDCALQGLKVTESQAQAYTRKDWTITGNQVIDCPQGMYIGGQGANLAATTGVTIQGNQVINNGDNTMNPTGVGNGLTVSWLRDATIQENNIIAPKGTGVSLRGVSGMFCDNRVTRSDLNGIDCQLEDDLEFNGNVITDCCKQATGAAGANAFIDFRLSANRTNPYPELTVNSLTMNVPDESTVNASLGFSLYFNAPEIRGHFRKISSTVPRPWRFDSPPIEFDQYYAQAADNHNNFTLGSVLNPSVPIFGSGRQRLYGTQSPQDLNKAATLVNTTNRVTVTAHGFYPGQMVRLRNLGAGVLPPELSFTTTYYAIIIDANTIQLASTRPNAAAGTVVEFSTNGEGSLGCGPSLWFRQGDFCQNTAFTPAARLFGWICSVSGNLGTWTPVYISLS